MTNTIDPISYKAGIEADAAPDGAERLALADFGPGKYYDAEMHVRFLRAQGGGSSGYTADLIEKLYFALRAGGWREDMAWDAPANRHHEPVERRAREIYDALPYGGLGEKPAWLPGGNSTKQDEARRLARNELRSQSYTPKNTDKEA